MASLKIIAFDADDTLWHTEHLYTNARDKLAALLRPHIDPETLATKLDKTEIDNLPIYGYGSKSFALSMIETTIHLTGGEITGEEMAGVLEIAREMLTTDPELIDGVEDVLESLNGAYDLIVVTKGDASEQMPKLIRAGIADHFRAVEVVGSKTVDTYRRILRKYALPPEHFLMVGNSLKSDILPVLAVGAHGVYVPSEIIWAHEVVEPPAPDHPRYHKLDKLTELPDLLRSHFRQASNPFRPVS